MKIGIDLDGCVVDYCNNLRDYLETQGITVAEGGDHNDPKTTWTFFKDSWGMSSEDFFKYCDQGVDEGFIFKEAKAIPGALESLARLSASGHEVHIVTNRDFGTKSPHNTVDWLEQHSVHYDSLTFAKDKTIVDCDLFLDDYEHNFLNSFKAGKPCCLMDRPWNRHVDAKDWRVESWEDFESVADRFDSWLNWKGMDFTMEFGTFSD